jgi:hypothetical protein
VSARARLSISGAAALVGVLALVSSAQAKWSPPVIVARSVADGPVLAGSPRHGATLAWLRDNPHVLTARHLGPRGASGRAQAFTGAFDPALDQKFLPQLGVADSGATVMVWHTWEFPGGYKLFARRMTPAGRLGPVRMIAEVTDAVRDADPGERLAVDAAGNATIVWNRVVGTPADHGSNVTSSTVQIRRFDADGSLGPVVEIPSQGARDFAPRLAGEPSGRAVVTWVRFTEDQIWVRAALIDRDGTLGVARDVSAPGPYWSGGAAEVVLDVRGKATISWGAPRGGRDVRTVRQLSSRGLGPLRSLGPGASALLAVDRFGTATLVWVDFAQVKARQIRRDGTLGPQRTLSAPSLDVPRAALATDGLGNTTVVWAGARVQARRLSREGRLGRVWTLTPDGPPGAMPAVVADARGVVTAVWGVGTADIQASRFVPHSR